MDVTSGTVMTFSVFTLHLEPPEYKLETPHDNLNSLVVYLFRRLISSLQTAVCKLYNNFIFIQTLYKFKYISISCLELHPTVYDNLSSIVLLLLLLIISFLFFCGSSACIRAILVNLVKFNSTRE